ncbi:MAG: DUF21 domain-containing protein [Elusimicrobia bacterium]|nr:DUF21 domain-containing protein [Elusimicrobiota bacterium]
MTLSLLAALVFLFCNAFFVMAEFALIRTQVPRVEVMQTHGTAGASLVLKILKHLDSYLSAIQIGITMCTLGLGWLGEPAVTHLISRHFAAVGFIGSHARLIGAAVSFALIMYFQIVFAELLPRNIAIHKAEAIALVISYPLEVYKRILQAPNWLLSKSAILVSDLVGVPPAGEAEQIYSEEEVRVMLGASQEKGLLPLDRLLLVENLFDLANLKVRDAMVPRERIIYLSTAQSWSDNLQVIWASHFSRFPLADPDLDHVSGLIHVKDLVGIDNPDLSKLKRKIGTVQDTEPLQPLLKSMTGQGQQILLAMRGARVSGLLALEDLLEEIVGEIHDEFDAPSAWSLHGSLQPELVDLELRGASSEECVQALAARIQTVHGIDPAQLIQAVLAREAQLPTAIGKGVAVPHARLASVSRPIIAVARSLKPVAFAAPDKVPVRLVFLILTPAAAPLEQLRILGRVAALVNNQTLLRRLMRAKNVAQFLDIIRTTEALVAG